MINILITKIYWLFIFTLCIILVEHSLTISYASVTCPPPQKVCGDKFCYDPATQHCTSAGSVIVCINATCGDQCYSVANQVCLNGTLCSLGQDLCEVKYDSYGSILTKPQWQCYSPQSKKCLNHTLCSRDQECNQQCMPYVSSYSYHQVCVNNTVCKFQRPYNTYVYQPDQIQLCNGSCYDTQHPPLKHCVNGTVQCISICSNQCYYTNSQVCLNNTLCNIGQNICESDFDRDGRPLYKPSIYCYDPKSAKCINRALCPNIHICNGQCITGTNAYSQVCANDKRTICNVTGSYHSYQQYRFHVCNGKCYDTTIRQCINGLITCIDDTCGDQCYNADIHVCINGTLCSLGQDFILTKPQWQCYSPQSTKCLNHTLCSRDQECNRQCMPYVSSYSYHQVCVNNTVCKFQRPYNTYVYQPDQIQLCNGSCYDTQHPPLKHCVNGTVQCISICSNQCYYTNSQVCLNNTLCTIGYDICNIGYQFQCYDPNYYKCFNNGICDNSRVCGDVCMTGTNQVCANDQHTICNMTKPYNNYQINQIQLCLGVCYDSYTQLCAAANFSICQLDPATQTCMFGNLSSLTTIIPPTTLNGSSTISTSTPVSSSVSSTSSTVGINTSTASSTVSSSTTLTSTTSSSTLSQEEATSTTTVKPTSESAYPTTTTASTSTSFSASTNPITVSNSSTITSTLSSGTSTITYTTLTSTLSFSSSTPSTTNPSLEGSCCSIQECTTDADCCIPGIECQCYHHNQSYTYGSCLNPHVQPICADGCPKEGICMTDTDCCKCQCGTITVTNVNGDIATKKQCVPR
ncbi:hypothetical protein I4U23_000256 [Adineta vaga]|nr:hypothetical protein I4U23_000256 [Adineta vaga]